ncbi:deoxyribose-phosphate aldolase [Sabulilitoribacter multivorans]|uniref:Deoxyribose-phosphate aldolase n=1 Tax=Flaviramulus multivorans TaxID=1304750 RepID=A0ABS9IHB8_9FLAO|nr:DUF6503 family protein [Flaviramulus multivorans]MCF7560162.1 deoxyribose-phosphate aldolase [Flaviramulus multivorans]
MIKKLSLISVLLILLLSCEQKSEDANAIIDKSIEVSGGQFLKKSIIGFEFRGRQYAANRYNGKFSLSRLTIKEPDTIFDTLNNNEFSRFVNGETIEVPDSMATRYSASVNSVHYFAVLPYGLNGKAVNKTYLKDVELKGKTYHKIKVTFDEEGGGEDFEDVFIYWVNTESFKVDYLAYSYAENDGTGLRFREAYNERYIEGIRFVDYNNYKPKNNMVLLESLDSLFENNELELLSKIELENIIVSLNSNQ